ncbi:MAG: hypothetical protein J5477_01055 [Schwartzia sp.]|nr:hypothetical protein [Schwartzia sp. (in: firmicutes)]
MVQKALKCKAADELLKLSEAEGYEMTKAEAEAYLAEIADFELDNAMLEKAAGKWWRPFSPRSKSSGTKAIRSTASRSMAASRF